MSGDSEKILFEGRFVRVVERGGWECCERTKAEGGVGVVAVTDDGRLVLVEEYRWPVRTMTIMLPAGLMDDEDPAAPPEEAVIEAARRELHEETGYEAERFEILVHGPPSAGISSEVYWMVRAHGPRKTGPGGGVGGERIIVHEIPLAEVPDWLAAQSRAGKLHDPKIYAALYFLGIRP